MGTSFEDVVAALRAAGCVFAEDEAALLGREATDADGRPDGVALARMLADRVAGAPLEQVLGWAEFAGLRIRMAPGVFVPRRRTELLVREAVAWARRRPGVLVVDLCCGSGAIAAAVRHAVPQARVIAADVDPVAVACARENLRAVGGSGSDVVCGDLFDPLPADVRGRVDLLTVNAPYVPTDRIAQMPPEARDHEPRHALDGGPDGLDVHRRIAAGLADVLAPEGHVLIEASPQQAPVTRELLRARGLDVVVRVDPEIGGCVVRGRRVTGS